MAVRSRFTRIPKVHDLVQAGVPTEVIPTYCALADYAGNRTGLAWPRMESLARRLKRSPRTIQRHLHCLATLKIIEFVERKRDDRGRFGAYVYRLVHIVAATARGEASRARGRGRERRSNKNRSTTGHEGLVASNKRLTKRHEDSPLPPEKDPKNGYWHLFDEKSPPEAEQGHRQEVQERREREALRRKEGFEFLFE